MHRVGNLIRMENQLKIYILQIMENLTYILTLISIDAKKIRQVERVQERVQNLYLDGGMNENKRNTDTG